ncbi:MAG: alkaline phosphatase [Bacteroidales bacterium]|nr:alkaline phosphatase [Bacteroidales bacterium]
MKNLKTVYKWYLVAILQVTILLLLACNRNEHQKSNTLIEKTPEIENIILLIGDGMGLAQIYSAIIVSEDSLNMEKINTIGFSKTYSFDNYITDSGAGSTAIACGIKTRNGSIGVDPEGQPVESIFEWVRDLGKSTGIVTTSSITDATPATFLAHNTNRRNFQAIALDICNSNVNLFMGGGKKYFTDRDDNLKLIDSLIIKGYEVVNNLDSINESSIKVAGLFAEEHLPTLRIGRDNYLAEATRKSIDILKKNEKGFMLVVEGAQIDFACHGGSFEFLVKEVLDFDKAVGVALDFAMENKKTLIVVTADHETGGLALIGGDIKSGEIHSTFAVKEHTGVMVPVLSYGPGSEEFAGFFENSMFKEKFILALQK